MFNETIVYYSKSPPNKWKLDDYTIWFWEENRMCGDDLKVYIKIQPVSTSGVASLQDIITHWSFEWDTAIITTACASIFGESIIGMTLKEVLETNYTYIIELIESEVSSRRRQAAVLWLLTTRNAIHTYLQDSVIDLFDDVIPQDYD